MCHSECGLSDKLLPSVLLSYPSLLQQTNLVPRCTFPLCPPLSLSLSHTRTHTSRSTFGSIIVPVWTPSMERCGLRRKERKHSWQRADSSNLSDLYQMAKYRQLQRQNKNKSDRTYMVLCINEKLDLSIKALSSPNM